MYNIYIMAIRYIHKNKEGQWAISNSETGKALRNAPTQKEAIALAGSMKSTESIMIKRSSGWGTATGWDQKVANLTKSKTTIKAEHKKPAAKKETPKKTAAKKDAPKKPKAVSNDAENVNAKITKTMPGWLAFIIGLFVIYIVVATAFLIGYYAL